MVKLQEKESTISDSEWEAMRIIWTLEPVSSTKIIEKLQAKKDWSESTIKTLLRRLVKKNLLSTKKEGRRFVYTAKVNQTQVMAEAAQELLKPHVRYA
jgi:predicted transcriptional regulator